MISVKHLTATLETPALISSKLVSFKFLGTHISNTLKWNINMDHIISKANQRLKKLGQLGDTPFSVSTQPLLRAFLLQAFVQANTPMRDLKVLLTNLQ